MLTDEQAEAYQDVLKLFKEFRGNLASVDDALSPKQQIELFKQVTKGRGSLPERMVFARKALELVTDKGQTNLFEALTERGALKHGELNEKAIRAIADATAVSQTALGRDKLEAEDAQSRAA